MKGGIKTCFCSFLLALSIATHSIHIFSKYFNFSSTKIRYKSLNSIIYANYDKNKFIFLFFVSFSFYFQSQHDFDRTTRQDRQKKAATKKTSLQASFLCLIVCVLLFTFLLGTQIKMTFAMSQSNVGKGEMTVPSCIFSCMITYFLRILNAI